jgi:hypothetical protein
MEAGVDGAKGVLKDHLHVPSEAPEVLLSGGEDILPFVEDLPLVGALQTEEKTSESALAGAAPPHETETLSFFESDAHVLEDPHLAALAEEAAATVALRHLPRFEKIHRMRTSSGTGPGVAAARQGSGETVPTASSPKESP